jgi:hypothetical protein
MRNLALYAQENRHSELGHGVKVFFSLALMVVGAIATYFFAMDIYGIFLYESEEGSQGITLVDWLYIVSPFILSLAVIFVGWRLHRSIPRRNPAEKSRTKSRTGLFLLLLGVAIAVSPVFTVFFKQLPDRNLFLDGPDANSLELLLLMFTFPIGAVFAIFGLVKLSDAKNIRIQTRVEPTAKPVEQTPIADADKAQEPAQIVNPHQSGDQVKTSSEYQAVYQPRSCTQVGLIVIAMFIGLNICFGGVSSFMNMSLHESWGILGVLLLLAGGGIIFWGIRRLMK